MPGSSKTALFSLLPSAAGERTVASVSQVGRRTGKHMIIRSILHSEADLTHSDYRLPPNVLILLIEDGSARLLDLGGNFYTISPVGAEMLAETLKVGTAAAAERIATKYATDVSHVQDDLQAFLHNLEEQRLICSCLD